MGMALRMAKMRSCFPDGSGTTAALDDATCMARLELGARPLNAARLPVVVTRPIKRLLDLEIIRNKIIQARAKEATHNSIVREK